MTAVPPRGQSASVPLSTPRRSATCACLYRCCVWERHHHWVTNCFCLNTSLKQQLHLHLKSMYHTEMSPSVLSVLSLAHVLDGHQVKLHSLILHHATQHRPTAILCTFSGHLDMIRRYSDHLHTIISQCFLNSRQRSENSNDLVNDTNI